MQALYYKKINVKWIAVVLFTAVTLFLAFNRHSRTGQFNYHSVIWADKAGYNVYLPATFIYHFDASAFPDNMDTRTGDGYELDISSKKVKTKYPVGVALLQLPFFVIAHTVAPFLGYEQDGYSLIYNWAINVSAVFYLIVGLLLLQRTLAYYFDRPTVLWGLFTLFAGTNLYYYTIDDAGMSHIYSFALFSAFLCLLKRSAFLSQKSHPQAIVFGLLCGLILVTRPTNAVFLTCFLFLDIRNWKEIRTRLKVLTRINVSIAIGISAFLVILVQMVYWKYAFGSFIFYSYEGEGFNWLEPRVLRTWFEPNNGLFLYTPLFLFMIISLALMFIRKVTNGLYLTLLFLGISYIFSCWDLPHFGCSFGARSYVEYLALFSIPTCYLLERILRSNIPIKLTSLALVLCMVAFNLKMTYSFDGCFYAKKDWDLPSYYELVVSPTK